MKKTLSASVLATLIVVGCGTAGASASEATGLMSADVGMTITGFDPAVAEANGYRIITDATGRQESVPVTDKAKRDEVQARAVGSKSFLDGTCGRASLTTRAAPSRGGINISTSYNLSKGRKSFGHLWKVSGQSRLGTPFTESFSGANNFDSSWSATHFRGLYGFSHGQNSLNVTNHAKLTNGTICTARTVINTW